MGRNARGSRVRGGRGANAARSEEFSLEWRSHFLESKSWMRVGPLPSERELQREESNLRDGRLTGGCLTIRLRWKNRLAAQRGAMCSASAVEPSCAKFSESEGVARDRARPWFRAQESNLCFWIQRPVSCQLDDPGVGHVERPRSQDAAVGPEGVEPSPPRLRIECACLLRYGPESARAGLRPARARVRREGVEPSSLGVKARCSARLS